MQFVTHSLYFFILNHDSYHIPEKDFSRIFTDVQGYGTVFLDRIRERQWYKLVYNNTDLDAYYFPDLVKEFYLGIVVTTIDHDHFIVHLDQGDLEVTGGTIEEATQISSSPQHAAPLPLINYMTLMGVRCTQLDRGVRANTIFCNIHCVGRWIQRNILGIDHTTSFYRHALQIIHSLMTSQHTAVSTPYFSSS